MFDASIDSGCFVDVFFLDETPEIERFFVVWCCKVADLNKSPQSSFFPRPEFLNSGINSD